MTTPTSAAPIAAAPIAFRCEHCLTTAHVPAKYAGRRGKCPTCHEAVIVPGTRVRSGRRRSKPQESWRPASERGRSSHESRRRAPKAVHTCRYCDEVLGRRFHECQAEVEPPHQGVESAAQKLDRVLAEKAEREDASMRSNLLIRLPLWILVFSISARVLKAIAII